MELRRVYPVFVVLVIGWCAAMAGMATAKLLWAAGPLEAIDDWLVAGLERPPPIIPPDAPSRASPPSERGDETIRRNVFCSRCAGEDPLPPPPAALPPSTLPLELVACMWMPRDPAASRAVIRSRSARPLIEGLYRAGALLPPEGARLLRVDPRRVWIEHRGRREYLSLDEEPPVAPRVTPATGVGGALGCDGGSCEIDRSLVERTLADPTPLLSAARLVPAVVGGRPAGLRLYAIRPGSLPAQLGLRDGDTLLSLNGQPLSDLGEALRTIPRLRHASHLALTLDRRGTPTTIEATIR